MADIEIIQFQFNGGVVYFTQRCNVVLLANGTFEFIFLQSTIAFAERFTLFAINHKVDIVGSQMSQTIKV